MEKVNFILLIVIAGTLSGCGLFWKGYHHDGYHGGGHMMYHDRDHNDKEDKKESSGKDNY